MNKLLIVPFILQSLVIGFDEFYFHVKRGLPRFERIGHPLDTLSLIICILFVLLFPLNGKMFFVFLSLAAVSCIFVTKDEFIHKHHCNASEQWLHALLFINHPLVLLSLGLMWKNPALFHPFLFFQLVLISLFCLYQVIYWNFMRINNDQ